MLTRSVVLVVAAVLGVLLAFVSTREQSQVTAPTVISRIQRAVDDDPFNADLQSQLAMAMIEPNETYPATANAESLHGGAFVLDHPAISESRLIMEKALKLMPGSAEPHFAHQAVLMAEGRVEEAIQPGRKAIELSSDSSRGYRELARSHLAAGCAQACAARLMLREEKKLKKNKASAQTQALAASGQLGGRGQGDGRDGGRGTVDRGSLRAGSMWRVMEAGRLLQTATKVNPTDDELAAMARKSKPLTNLNAHQVSSASQLIHYGECEWFYGKTLDGGLCDRKRHGYE